MDNLIFIGKYSLYENFQTADAKRVINQVNYLKHYYKTLIITLSPKGSSYNFNINLKSNAHKNFIDLIRFFFYWFYIIWLLTSRREKKNYLILESVVELYSSIPILFAKLLGYKIVHDVVEDFSLATVDTTTNQKLIAIISKWYEKRIIKYCSGLIIISQRLLLKFQYLDLPIIKIYNSVPCQNYTPGNKEPNKFVYFYSGSFGSKDGVKDLIDAFELIFRSRKNIHLKLVGKGYGKYYDECLKKIKGNDNITYLGFLPENEMITELRSSHVLCITRTNSEFANNGFPFKLAEYMSFGIPVLTTTVSDIPLILKNNDTAFFAIPEDIGSIAETMKKIILNYNNSIEVGKNGRSFCLKNFSINTIGTQFQSFLESIN